MSYYHFNRQEILQKVKEKYSKEKAAEYYLKNKEYKKEKTRNRYRNLSEEEKNKIKEYQKRKYQEMIVVSGKFRHSEEGYKYFIGYQTVMYYLTSNECLHQIFWKWRKKHVLLN